jgi:hypothetical protein
MSTAVSRLACSRAASRSASAGTTRSRKPMSLACSGVNSVPVVSVWLKPGRIRPKRAISTP